MTIGSVNYTGTVSRQFYAPKRQQNCYVQNNTVSPAFKGNADEICLNEDNNKSKFEIILDNRVKKGLNPEMAKELSKLYSPVIDIVLAKDNAGMVGGRHSRIQYRNRSRDWYEARLSGSTMGA